MIADARASGRILKDLVLPLQVSHVNDVSTSLHLRRGPSTTSDLNQYSKDDLMVFTHYSSIINQQYPGTTAQLVRILEAGFNSSLHG